MRDAVLEREIAPELIYKIIESVRASETGGTEAVNSAMRFKAYCHLGSGRYEEMK